MRPPTICHLSRSSLRTAGATSLPGTLSARNSRAARVASAFSRGSVDTESRFGETGFTMGPRVLTPPQLRTTAWDGRDFNYELGADVFTTEALRKVVNMSKGEGHEVAARQFGPWRVMDENPKDFVTLEHPGSANYCVEKVSGIKEKLGRLLQENQVHYGWQFPASSYAFIGPLLPPDGMVLDIACGQGSGSRQLMEYHQQVVGVDLDQAYINQATQQFSDVEGLSYICADACSFSEPNTYDTIVSMHTLEHLSNDKQFLTMCHQNLKRSGKLFLEVPLLLPRPLGEPLYPFHSKEYLKHELEELCTEAGFVIEKKVGRDRGVYTSIDLAREAVQYHCSVA